MSERDEVDRTYREIADRADKQFALGAVRLDPYLLDRDGDKRRGLSVIARPDRDVLGRLTAVLGELAELEPAQYLYRPAEIHLTVLTLVKSSDQFESRRRDIPQFEDITRRLAMDTPPIDVSFTGLMATPDGVIVKGYPRDGTLREFRDRLRAEIQAAGLGASMDIPYAIKIAHCTILRFRTPLNNLATFRNKLNGLSDIPLGTVAIGQIDLVTHDWYISTGRTECIASYRLGDPTP